MSPPGACTATAGGPGGERFRGRVEGDCGGEGVGEKDGADEGRSRRGGGRGQGGGRRRAEQGEEGAQRQGLLPQPGVTGMLIHLCLLKIMVSHLGASGNHVMDFTK